jgi:Contractile injection system tube protein
MASFPPLVKCMIVNLDNKDVVVKAMFNPKEIGIEKTIPWNKHKSSVADIPVLEFTDPDGKELNIELLFDTFEQQKSVWDEHIKTLESLTQVVKEKKRPPMVLFTWGSSFPNFMGVIASLSVKYTMFLPNGAPCRANATVKIKEAKKLEVKTNKDAAKKDDGYDPRNDHPPDEEG